MKNCSRCQKVLELGSFYKDKQKKEGLMSHCKNCDRLLRRERRAKYPETYRLRDRRYYAKHKSEKVAYLRDWRSRNSIKVTAHQAVRSALRRGLLTKSVCFCGEVRVDAHHEDYSKPLEVLWLCRTHHERIHS